MSDLLKRLSNSWISLPLFLCRITRALAAAKPVWWGTLRFVLVDHGDWQRSLGWAALATTAQPGNKLQWQRPTWTKDQTLHWPEMEPQVPSWGKWLTPPAHSSDRFLVGSKELLLNHGGQSTCWEYTTAPMSSHFSHVLCSFQSSSSLYQ